MEAVNVDWRLQLLKKQLQLDKSNWCHRETVRSLNRLVDYVYLHTDIVYIEFINEEILYNYIDYHRQDQFKEISFLQAIKDIKTYLSFLEKDTHSKQYIPKIDLSINNYFLWTEL